APVPSNLYGDPVAITDPGHPADPNLMPTGVNSSAVISASERTPHPSTPDTYKPVVWSYTGDSTNPVIKVNHLAVPSDGSTGVALRAAGITDAGSVYGTLSLTYSDSEIPFIHAARWSTSGT